MALLEDIWFARIQLLPVLLTILLFELPAVIRRWKKLLYVPIYFPAFPLREINQDLSTYLAEDEFYGEGERLTEQQAETLRRKIIRVSIISMGISALLTPLAVGFVSAFYLSNEVFFQFLTILVGYKVILLSKSVYEIHYYTIGSIRNRVILAVIYIIYLGVIFEVLRTSYIWTIPYVQSQDWSKLLSDLSTLIFGKAIIGAVLVSLLTAVFVSLVTEKSVRERALSKDK